MAMYENFKYLTIEVKFPNVETCKIIASNKEPTIKNLKEFKNPYKNLLPFSYIYHNDSFTIMIELQSDNSKSTNYYINKAFLIILQALNNFDNTGEYVNQYRTEVIDAYQKYTSLVAKSSNARQAIFKIKSCLADDEKDQARWNNLIRDIAIGKDKNGKPIYELKIGVTNYAYYNLMSEIE